MNNMFRELTDVEKGCFKDWARKNYEPFAPIQGIWHTIVQSECVLINEEKSLHMEALPYPKDDLGG